MLCYTWTDCLACVRISLWDSRSRGAGLAVERLQTCGRSFGTTAQQQARVTKRKCNRCTYPSSTLVLLKEEWGKTPKRFSGQCTETIMSAPRVHCPYLFTWPRFGPTTNGWGQNEFSCSHDPGHEESSGTAGTQRSKTQDSLLPQTPWLRLWLFNIYNFTQQSVRGWPEQSGQIYHLRESIQTGCKINWAK